MSEKITFETEDGDIELYVLEQTTLFGVNYILVTDDEESEDGSFFVLKEEPDSEGDVVSYAEDLSLKMNDSQVIPSRAVELRVKIPKDWDTSKIEVQWYYPVNEMFNPIEYFDSSS